MKRTVFFAIIFSTLIFGISAAERMRIAIFDFQNPCGIENYEAEQISEIVRTEIMVTEAFTVLEKSQVDKLFGETGFQLSGLVSEENIVELGNIIEADYVIDGSIGVIGGAITLTARLISLQSGENVFSSKLITVKETIFTDLARFSKSLANKTVELTYGLTAENIENLIRMRSYETAFRKLQLYKEKYGESEETATLEKEINRGIADEFFRKARFSLKQGYYNQAVSYTEQMFRFVPESTAYENFFKKLERARNRKERQARRDCIREVKQLINKGYLETAEKKLDDYLLLYGIDARDESINALYTQIRESLAEEQYILSKSLLNQKKFDPALDAIMKAAEIFPGKEKYIDLVGVIHNRIEKSTRKTYKKVNRPPFFSIGSRLPVLLQTSGGIRFFNDPYDEIAIEGVYPDFDFRLMILSELLDPFHLTYVVNTAFTFGNSAADGANVSYSTSFWSPTLAAGFGTAVTLAYVDFGLFADLYGGVLHRDTVRTVFGAREELSSLSFICGPGINVWTSWYFATPFQIFLRYRASWLVLFKYRTTANHSLSIGMGVNL